jgi:hypothetical protein
MTEAEWLTESDPMLMVEFLRESASDRKLRLFAAESFRHLLDLLPDVRQRTAIEVLEEMAEGTITKEARGKASRDVRCAIPPDDRVGNGFPMPHLHYAALMLYRAFASANAAGHACHAADSRADSTAERLFQRGLLCELFGNPFRPVAFDPAWRTSDVLLLARGIYEERAFDRMPILADALQDAGCESDVILSHLRDANATHVRGCWALDLVLGKE